MCVFDKYYTVWNIYHQYIFKLFEKTPSTRQKLTDIVRKTWTVLSSTENTVIDRHYGSIHIICQIVVSLINIINRYNNRKQIGFLIVNVHILVAWSMSSIAVTTCFMVVTHFTNMYMAPDFWHVFRAANQLHHPTNLYCSSFAAWLCTSVCHGKASQCADKGFIPLVIEM